MYIYYTPPVFYSSYVPTYYGGYYPFFADPYYSSPLDPITDWISSNKYSYSAFNVPSFWGFGFSSRDMSLASFGDTLWYRSAGFTFFDSPWGTSWEFEFSPPFGKGGNGGILSDPSTSSG